MGFYFMEVWKSIEGFEGFYEISTFGNIKSLSRTVKKNEYDIKLKEKILKPFKNSNGYLHIELNKNGIGKKIKIHTLMSINFLNHIPNKTHDIVVDHIDNNKFNNNLNNLQLLTNRQNCSKEQRGFRIYTGVGFVKIEKKWRAYISINKKFVHLGYFKTEIEAHNAYQLSLKNI